MNRFDDLTKLVKTLKTNFETMQELNNELEELNNTRLESQAETIRKLKNTLQELYTFWYEPAKSKIDGVVARQKAQALLKELEEE